MEKKPLVSICCITYNHEGYIRDAIEGFLIQEVDFPIEIIIHDDASTDDTAEIIKEYEEKHPNLIKPIYQDENQFSQGNTPIYWNFVFPKAKGKYIALCDGDDYWTDPLKLQQQVDYLEEHSEYIMSFHDAKIINDKGEVLSKSKLKYNFSKKDHTKEQVVRGPIMSTMTVVFRNHIIDYALTAKYKVKNGDTFLFSLLGQYGRANYSKEVDPAVYRAHAGGIWSSKNRIAKKEDGIKTYQALLKAVNNEFKPIIRSELIYRLISLSVAYFKDGFYKKSIYKLIITKSYVLLSWTDIKYFSIIFIIHVWRKLQRNILRINELGF